MSHPHIGDIVVTPNGTGSIDTITVGDGLAHELLRYRVTFDTTTRRRWYYADELTSLEPARADQ